MGRQTFCNYWCLDFKVQQNYKFQNHNSLRQCISTEENLRNLQFKDARCADNEWKWTNLSKYTQIIIRMEISRVSDLFRRRLHCIKTIFKGSDTCNLEELFLKNALFQKKSSIKPSTLSKWLLSAKLWEQYHALLDFDETFAN
jgi:hypothetical protein